MLVTERWARVLRLGLALALAPALSACGSLRLYSEARDKQGEAAKTQWAAAKKAVDEQVATARTINVSLVQAEVAAHEKSILQQRDISMQQLALGGSVKGLLEGTAGMELALLVGQGMATSPPLKPPSTGVLAAPANPCESIISGQDDKFCVWQNALAAPAKEQATIASAGLVFERFLLELPSCSTLDKAPGTPKALVEWLVTRRAMEADKSAPAGGADSVDGALGSARSACGRLAKLPVLCPNPTAGNAGNPEPSCDSALGQTLIARTAAQMALAAAKESSKEQRNEWRAAVTAYEAAAAKLKPGQEATDAVKNAASKLTTAAQALVKVDDLFGKKFLSESRREASEKLIADLASATEGEKPAEGASKVAEALYTVPQAIDKFGEDLKAAKKPLLLVAAMERDRQQALVDVLDKDIKQLETVVGLRDAEAMVMTQRAFLLRDANKLYTYELKPLDPEGKATMSDLHAAFKDDLKREKLYTALGTYYHAQGRLLVEERQLRIQRYGLAYEANVNHAEAAVRQWQALIDNSVELLAAFGKSGLRSEQLTDLVSTIGVLWIGRGVNVK